MIISIYNQMPFSHSLFKISSTTIYFLMSYNFSFSFPPEGVLLQNIQLTQDLCFQSGKDVFLDKKELSILIWYFFLV
jgi:hypothetical protein